MNFRWIFLLLTAFSVQAQSGIEGFLRPSDSLNKIRRNGVFIGQALIAAGTYSALHGLWYKDYQKSGFHFINDSEEWLQMDKAGHAFSTYTLSRMSNDLYAWSGMSRNNRIILSSLTGFAFVSAIEVFDGYSAEWGASPFDIAANAGGSLLYAGQELLWDEQRITMKYSFHSTPYASARPGTLGSSYNEQMVKDYNGQTYWLSVNLNSFLKTQTIPDWLNVAIGYGAEGMITGSEFPPANQVFLPEKTRVRQYYLSLDADLTRIKTKSHLLKTVFSAVNCVKIPFPALEINGRGKAVFRGFYF